VSHEEVIHDAGGARVACSVEGQGEPLLLVHGYLVSRSSWDAVAGPLGGRFTLHRPDLPGHGASDCAGGYPYSVEAFVRTLEGLMDGLGLARAAVMGHSLGGAVAAALAARCPERVARLVLVDPVLYPLALPLEARVALVPGLGGLLFKTLYRRRDLHRYFRRDVYLDPRLPTEEMVDRCWAALSRPGGKDAAHRTLAALGGLEVLAGVPARLRCPVLLVWGEQDRIVPVAHGRRLLAEIPGARLEVIGGCGHPPHEERPAAFLEAVLPFLAAP